MVLRDSCCSSCSYLRLRNKMDVQNGLILNGFWIKKVLCVTGTFAVIIAEEALTEITTPYKKNPAEVILAGFLN